MKTCSNIPRLTPNPQGSARPHILPMKHEGKHIHKTRTGKQWRIMARDTGHSESRWFSLDVTDTVRCSTYAQSDENKGQKNPVVNTRTGITWRGFQMTRLNVLSDANSSFSICVPAKHKLALMYKLSLFYHLPQTETGFLLRTWLPPHPHVLRQVKTDPPTQGEYFWRGTDRTLTPVSLGAICNHWQEPSFHTGHLQLLPTGFMLLQLFTTCSPGLAALMTERWTSITTQRGHSLLRDWALLRNSLFRGPSYGKYCRSLVLHLPNLWKKKMIAYHSNVWPLPSIKRWLA